MAGKKMVDRVAIWRVRDRKRIEVWNDKWINKPPTFKVQLIDQNQPTPMKVSHLMTADGNRWNTSMLMELMNEGDATLVRKSHRVEQTRKID